MGLVKTRRLAAMQKQTTLAKAMVVRQKAKLGICPPKPDFNPPRTKSKMEMIWKGDK